MTTAAGFLTTLALAAGTVAITGAMQSGHPHRTSQPDGQTHRGPIPQNSSSNQATQLQLILQPRNSSSSSSVPPNSSATLIPQTIRFTSSPPSGLVVGDNYAVTASGGGSGNRVMLEHRPRQHISIHISGSTVTFNSTGSCVIDANQAGNATYAAAPQAQQTIGGQIQSISFTPPTPGLAGGSATLSAAGGRSGNPVVFSVDRTSGPGVCTVSGATVNYAAAGTCVIDANQAGNATYTAAPQVQQTTTVGRYCPVDLFHSADNGWIRNAGDLVGYRRHVRQSRGVLRGPHQ